MSPASPSLHLRLTTFLLAATLGSSGCAYGTFITGSRQQVLFKSNPEGAVVKVNGEEVGKTPVATKLTRKHDAFVELEKPGCKKKELTLDSTISPVIFANIFPFFIAGLALGCLFDFSSGGAYKLDPDQVYANLDCDEPPKPSVLPPTQ